MALKIKRTNSEDFGRWVKMLVCGDPGAGKTLTASTWPNPLYVNAEGGLLSLQDRNIAALDVTDTAMLQELRGVLQQPPAIRERELGVPVETVVVDTFDEVARMFVKERMEATGKDTLAIQDWGWLGEQLRAMVRSFRNLPMNVILNSHIKSVTDEETGKLFLKPAIQGAMGDELPGYVDLAVVLVAKPITEVQNGKNVRRIVRIMQTFPDSRQPWIKDRSGKMPMEFPINFQDDYKRIYELIFGGSPVAQNVQATVVQPGQEEDVIEEAEAVIQAVADVPSAGKKKPGRPKKVDAAVEVQAVPDVVPEPEFEPPAPAVVVPEPTVPEPEPVVPEPVPVEPVPDLAVQDSVSPVETPKPAVSALVCADCSGEIATKDQADLSYIRFRRRLCKDCFRSARSRK